MNEKIHHFSIRLHVLGGTTVALLPSFTFTAFYCKRLWFIPLGILDTILLETVCKVGKSFRQFSNNFNKALMKIKENFDVQIGEYFHHFENILFQFFFF